MDIFLRQATIHTFSQIRISGSKSETNRSLLLQAIFPEIRLENPSDSDDSKVMAQALSGRSNEIDIHHAGTAMRFLTAFFACADGTRVTLTGSGRMKQRPIGILVRALRQLGAEIEYAEKEGFPPLRITGKTLTQKKACLEANVSSQYISALLLIAPKLQNGLELALEGEITSAPYIRMTLSMLNEAGIQTAFENNLIKVFPGPRILNLPPKITVESDWSSASYYYSIIALSPGGTQMALSSYKKDSFQGDSELAVIYENFGVQTVFHGDAIILTRKDLCPDSCALDLVRTPDLAQTIAVTCFGLGISCRLTGLHTLKIKETDRLEALKTELSKLGAKVSVTGDSLILEASQRINPQVRIATYDDHRMAMAFAPLALKVPVIIENAEVVSKSYPAFWGDLQNIGFRLAEKG